MGTLDMIKSVIKVEIFLSITLFLLPILLPITSGELLSSVSHYAYSKSGWLYGTMLSLISVLLIYDGIKDSTRRFNLLLGVTMLGVVIFPVEEHRYIHDIFAIMFFLENLTILIYYSKVFSKHIKVITTMVVVITLTLLFLGTISLFFAEAIGLICVSVFFFIRFLKIY